MNHFGVLIKRCMGTASYAKDETGGGQAGNTIRENSIVVYIHSIRDRIPCLLGVLYYEGYHDESNDFQQPVSFRATLHSCLYTVIILICSFLS